MHRIDVRMDAIVAHFDARYLDLRERIELLREEVQASVARDHAVLESTLELQAEWAAVATRLLSELRPPSDSRAR